MREFRSIVVLWVLIVTCGFWGLSCGGNEGIEIGDGGPTEGAGEPDGDGDGGGGDGAGDCDGEGADFFGTFDLEFNNCRFGAPDKINKFLGDRVPLPSPVNVFFGEGEVFITSLSDECLLVGVLNEDGTFELLFSIMDPKSMEEADMTCVGEETPFDNILLHCDSDLTGECTALYERI